MPFIHGEENISSLFCIFAEQCAPTAQIHTPLRGNWALKLQDNYMLKLHNF